MGGGHREWTLATSKEMSMCFQPLRALFTRFMTISNVIAPRKQFRREPISHFAGLKKEQTRCPCPLRLAGIKFKYQVIKFAIRFFFIFRHVILALQ